MAARRRDLAGEAMTGGIGQGLGRLLLRGIDRLRTRLLTVALRRTPAVGQVRFGHFGRLVPFSRRFGFDRGLPIDRYYIEAFLRRHGVTAGYGVGDVHGRVLEVGGDVYARAFGGPVAGPGNQAGAGVSSIDVLHVDVSNPAATIIGDLVSGKGLPTAAFDCVICTQVLHALYDVDAAISTLHRILRPGGVALVTVPGISQVCRPERELWGDFWRFTTLSARRAFERHFPPEGVEVDAYGNVLAAVSFLHGLASEDLRPAQLDVRDPDYELLITIRAVRRG